MTAALLERNRRFFLAFLNHIVWSTQPVASRYLQVYATPVVFDGQAILCTVKLASAIFIYSFSHCVCPDELRQQKKSISASSTSSEEGINDSNPSRKAARPQTKLFFALLFGLVATCRAALNIASTKFTVSYYLTTINSLTPLVVSIGDSLLLGADLPPALWPCVFSTFLSGATIGLSHSSIFVSAPQNKASFTTSDWIGCLLQFASMCFSAAARLLMKRTENILTRDEAVQSNNFCNTIFPLLYTLVTNRNGWNAFVHMSVSSFLAWSCLAVLVYTVGSSGQMSLVRSMGPALYSSLSAVRVLSSALLSSIFLREAVRNWLEWVGLVIAMITMTAYTISSVDANECNYCGKKQEVGENDDVDEMPSIPMTVLAETEDAEREGLLPSS